MCQVLFDPTMELLKPSDVSLRGVLMHLQHLGQSVPATIPHGFVRKIPDLRGLQAYVRCTVLDGTCTKVTDSTANCRAHILSFQIELLWEQHLGVPTPGSFQLSIGPNNYTYKIVFRLHITFASRICVLQPYAMSFPPTDDATSGTPATASGTIGHHVHRFVFVFTQFF